MPDGWVWCKISDISDDIIYGVSESAKNEGKYKLLRITDIHDSYVDWSSVPFTDFDDAKVQAYLLNDGDILFARTGATVGKSYLVSNLQQKTIYASYLIRIKTSRFLLSSYLKFFFESGYYWEQISSNQVGVGQPNVNGTILAKLLCPLPPFEEQQRIIEELRKWMTQLDVLEKNKTDLKNSIKDIKSKILSLAIQGKLVEQDPADEAAEDLLKRINPSWRPCDTSQYENLPQNWVKCKLEDVIDYEQPQRYIVASTDYSDKYSTPVLTAGKSFIIGHTNETDGIFTNVPVIIFDDFTTESKLVDFPFKVKSSAMKILHVKKGIDIGFIYLIMSITRLVGDTHKRYWISEYSKIPILLPPIAEQKRIVNKIKRLFAWLDEIESQLQ